MRAKHIIILSTILFMLFSSAYAQDVLHTPRYYVHRAEGYVSSNAWNTAKREIDAGLKAYPDDPDLRYLNGRYYFIIGDINQARYNLVRATQTNDMHFKAKRLLVDVEDKLQHYSSAICYINELLEFLISCAKPIAPTQVTNTKINNVLNFIIFIFKNY